MDSGELRNLKDFLYLFNKLSESCFKQCVYDLGNIRLQPDEINCVDTCIKKRVNANQRLMQCYVEINPEFQERKMKEYEESAKALVASQAEKSQ